MLHIKPSKVPAYLRGSVFFKSLNEEDDEEITVPSSNLKGSTQVTDSAELIHLLSTARFWGLDELPAPALHYAMYIADEDVFVKIEEYEDHMRTIACLKAIRFAEGDQKVLCAAEFGRVGLLKHLLDMGSNLTIRAGIQAASNNHLSCLEFITCTLIDEKTGKNPYKLIKLCELPATITYACWKYLHQQGAKIDRDSIVQAAAAGNLTCLQYLHENNVRVTKKSMEGAAANGHLACVAFIHEQGKIAVDADCAVLSAAAGHLECLKYLFESGCLPALRISTAAAHGGHIECLRYAHKQGCPMNKTTMSRTHSLECVKYMREHKVKWDVEVFKYAMAEERLDFLQYFYEQGELSSAKTYAHRGDVFSAACTTTGVTLRFLYEHGVAVNPVLVSIGILSDDNLSCLKIAMEFGFQSTAANCAHAAESGAIECLKYLHSCKCPWDESLCTRAAQSAQLVTLQYALQHGCPANADACEAAATSYGQQSLECLQALHEAGCPWDERTTAAAATAPQGVAKLTYAYENGCPWDETTCNGAAGIGRSDALRYALKHGCPCSSQAYMHAIQHSNGVSNPAQLVSVVQDLHQSGCPWDSFVSTMAAQRGLLEVLQYAHENNCPCSEDTSAAAASASDRQFYVGSTGNGQAQFDCLKYLHDQGCPWDVTATNAAAKVGNLTVLKYLREEGCPCDETTQVLPPQNIALPTVCSICMRTAVPGTQQPALPLLSQATMTSLVCSMPLPTAVPGTKARALLLAEDLHTASNLRTRTVAPGTALLARKPPMLATYLACSTRTSRGALGIMGLTKRFLSAKLLPIYSTVSFTWILSSPTCRPTAAPGQPKRVMLCRRR